MRSKLLLCMTFLTACATVRTPNIAYPDFFQKITPIKVGDTQDSVLGKLGKPADSQLIEVQSKKFEVYEYLTNNRIPLPSQSITFEPETKRTVAVLTWISPGQAEYNGDELIKIYFPTVPFKRFHPCDVHFGGRFDIAQEQGIVIGYHRSKTDFVAITTPEYASLWAAAVYAKCPKLQSPEFLN